MGVFAFLVKEAWPWAVNTSGTVDRAWCRQEGCPGLHPSPALPNHGIAEPGLGRTHWGCLLQHRMVCRHWQHSEEGKGFTKGRRAPGALKIQREPQNSSLTSPSLGGKRCGRDDQWSPQWLVCLFRVSLFSSVLSDFCFFFILFFSCLCSPGHTAGFPLPWLNITGWQHSMSHQLASG